MQRYFLNTKKPNRPHAVKPPVSTKTFCFLLAENDSGSTYSIKNKNNTLKIWFVPFYFCYFADHNNYVFKNKTQICRKILS